MVRAPFAAPALLVALALVTSGCSSGGTSSSASSGSAGTSTTSTSTAAPATTAESATTSATSNNQVITVAVSGGKVKPAPAAIPVKLGSTITIQATADVADEVHIHGYDKHLDLEPNQQGSIDLTANIPGEFEVELEDAHLLLFTLRVS
jgi:plastocyanin